MCRAVPLQAARDHARPGRHRRFPAGHPVAYPLRRMLGWPHSGRQRPSARAVRWAGALYLCAGLLLGACGEDPTGGSPPEPIAFTPAPGSFREPFELTARTSLSGATIHYTLDGSLPTAAAPVFDGPLTIGRSTQVRAVAIAGADGPAPSKSKIVSAQYLRVAASLEAFESNLPIAVVHMLGARAPDRDEYDYQPAALQLFTPNGAPSSPLGPAALDTRIGIKVRGRSTRSEPKVSHSIELWDEYDQDDFPRALLDMPAHADWALYGPHNWDRSYLRNALVYALSRDIGEYAPRTRFVEGFLVERDGDLAPDSYYGLLLLIERIKQAPLRVPVEPLTGSDRTEPSVSGGYIVKADDPGPGEHGFVAGGLELAYVYPKEADIVAAQAEYIADYFEEVARAVQSADGHDPVSGQHFEALIDVDSFIDHHILNLYAKNPDALRLSAYFHKHRGGPLRAGPVWDFDRSLGSTDPRDDDPTGWNATGDGTRMFEHPLWGDLLAHEQVRRAYSARLRSLLTGALSTARVHALIDRLADEIGAAAVRDAERWPGNRPRGGSYENEIEDLKAWTAARATWLLDNADNLPR